LALSISKTSLQDCILGNKEVNKTSGYFYDVSNTFWSFLICEYCHYPELIQFPCLVCAGLAMLKIEGKFSYQRALISSIIDWIFFVFSFLSGALAETVLIGLL